MKNQLDQIHECVDVATLNHIIFGYASTICTENDKNPIIILFAILFVNVFFVFFYMYIICRLL